MRLAKITLALSLLFVGPADAGWGIFQDSVPTVASGIVGFNTLALGPGEQVTNNDVECDQGLGQCSPGVGTVTMVARTDSYNAWYRNSGGSVPYCGAPYSGQPTFGCWVVLVRPDTMPIGTTRNGSFNQGIPEIQVAPSNTNVAYFIWDNDGCLYWTNQLANVAAGTARWVKLSAQPSGACLPGGGPNNYGANTSANGSKFFHPFIGIDPHNPAVVIVSTPGNQGTYVSTNSGASWTKITAIGNASAAGDGSGGGAVIAYDRNSSTGGSPTQTQSVFVCVYGNGVWHSATGATGTFTQQTGSSGTMPTKCREVAVDPAGTLYVADDNNSFWGGASSPFKNTDTYTLGTTTWQQLTSLSTTQVAFQGIAIDYNTNCSANEAACHICVGDQGAGMFCSSTGNSGVGSGFATYSGTVSWTANSVPWAASAGNNLSQGGNLFDMSTSNTVQMTYGFGYLTVNVGSWPPTNLPVTTFGEGIAQFNGIRAIDPCGTPFVSMYDHSVAPMLGGPGVIPTVLGNGLNGGINAGWDISSVASSTCKIVILATGQGNASGIYDGVSSWSAFANMPTEIVTPGSGNIAAPGGGIAASTPTNIVIVGGQDADMYVTANGASTAWTLTCPGNGTGVACGGIAQTSSSGTPTTLSFSSVPAQILTGFNTNGYGYNVVDATACPNDSSIALTGATSTTITIASRLCPISSAPVSVNDYIWIRPNTGWQNAAANQQHRITADAAANGTFYALYDGQGSPGVWVSINGGSSWALGFNGQLSGGSNATFNAAIEAVPGVNNDMYANEGANGTNSIYECGSTGTGLANSVTCTAIVKGSTSPIGGVTYGGTVTNVQPFCYGKNKTGTYPSVYFYGTLDTGSGGVLSWWQTNDHFQTFTNLQTVAGIKPIASFDYYGQCGSDLTTYGTVIAPTANSDGFCVQSLP